MRDYAANYIAKLPDFVCQQVTLQFQADKHGKRWHRNDTLTSKLVFTGGREERTLQLVNNKRARNGSARLHTPLSTEGEFGILLDKVFDPASQAKFSWAAWETIRGARLARFNYVIDRQHSTLTLTNFIKATVAYRGSVYADPATGTVLRLTSGSSEIPEDLQMTSIATSVDYDRVKIGGNDYLLPVSAEVLLVTGSDQVRNEMHFEDYRKFEAESSITFGQENGDASKPSDKTPHSQQP